VNEDRNIGKKLTLREASGIIAGYGIGGGVLALPFLVSLNGLGASLLVISAAYFLSLLLHLMIAELCAGEGSGKQILELFKKYLFTGRSGGILTWFFFILMAIAFFTNLAAYVAGGGEVLASLCDSIGVPVAAGNLAFYAAAAAVAAMGLKALGVAEKWAIALMFVLFAALAVATLAKVAGTGLAFASRPPSPTPRRILALYGMAMFSFSAFFSVPQAVKGLSDRPQLIARAVASGLGINAGIVAAVIVLTLAVPGDITAIATVGWAKALGSWAGVAGTVFVMLAMLTSYWSIAQALADIFRERLGIGAFPAFLAATVPTLALSFAGGFLGFMRTAGGGIAVLVAVLLVPAYRNYRARVSATCLLPAFMDKPLWGWVAAAAYLCMAAGSMIEIR
jgi:amino acid permease